MKILLFGGRGQVGWELQRALSPLGTLVVVGRETANFENCDGLAAILALEAPDIIVNAAAYTSVDGAETDLPRARAVNAVAVETLARTASRQNALLIHYSTDYVFDGMKSGAYNESDPANPLNAYGRTKNEGEEAILASDCEHLIFRTSWIHSSRGTNFVHKILQLARVKNSLTVVADQWGSPTGAEMIADITALAVARRGCNMALPSGLYHLAASGSTSRFDFARFIVAEALGQGYNLKVRPDMISPIPSSQYQTAARRPLNSVLDSSRLSMALAITPPDWSHHARRTVLEILEK